ncbi:MAG: SDR family oxidoreductase [Bacteroidota bacterium]
MPKQQHWAIILGGSSGLGWATAQKLAAEGYHLCLVHRDPRARRKQAETAFAELRDQTGVQLLHYNQDALREDIRTDIVNDLKNQMDGGKVRVLVHSIARGNLKLMLNPDGPSLATQDFELTTQAMALSFYEWTKTLLQAELFAPTASAIGFTSEGSYKAWPNYAAVSVAKASLEALIKNMAAEFAPHGLRTNGIQAGVTDTPSLRMIPGSELLKARSIERNPFQRLTHPEDVANAVYLLCLPEANWINGAIIPVDGGERLR